MSAQPLEVLEQRIRQLHAAGYSQAEIARRVGVTRWQVRTTAARLGLSWDTQRTAAATAASLQHARRERVALALRWLDTAGDELDDADAAEDAEARRRHVVNAAIGSDKAAVLLARGLDDVGAEVAEGEARAALSEFMAAITGSVD